MIFTGFIMYGASQSSSSIYQMSLINNMIFGAGISATDPVAVLIVFSTLGADSVLFALVLGESVLNDAVALVLYQTMSQFQTSEPTATLFVLAILVFCGIFLASMAIGFLVGVLASFFFKHVKYYKYPEVAKIESGLTIVIPYFAYFLAQAAGFSGITSISFCGIAMSEWGGTSVSHNTKIFLEEAYGAIAQTFEAFTFIFMGIAFVNLDHNDTPVIYYALTAFGAILVARALHVMICVFLGNLARPRKSQVNWTGTFALFVVGLRGPMAFFVSVQASTELVNQNDGQTMKSATIILICLTTPIIGIIMPYLVRAFDLTRQGSASEGGWTCCWGRSKSTSTSTTFVEDTEGKEQEPPPPQRFITGLFLRMNEKYFKPWLATSAEENKSGAVNEEPVVSIIHKNDDG